MSAPRSVKDVVSLADMYSAAQAGDLAECAHCPRRPLHDGMVAEGRTRNPRDGSVFAMGCDVHQRSDPGGAAVAFVLRDPSISPDKPWVGCEDGHVCPWCHSDPSANYLTKLFEEHLEPILPRDAAGRRPVYFTNAVLHGVPNGKAQKNTKPTAEERRACRPVLARQLELLRPRVVLALGLEACASVAHLQGLRAADLLGASKPLMGSGGLAVWGTYHPSPLAHAKREEIQARFSALATWLRQTEER